MKNHSHDWSSSDISVVYNARSSRNHPPISPNIAPNTKFWLEEYRREIIGIDAANINLIRPYSEHIRTYSDYKIVIPSWRSFLYGKIQHFAVRLSPKISCNGIPATKSHTSPLPNIAPITKNTLYTSPFFFTPLFSKHQFSTLYSLLLSFILYTFILSSSILHPTSLYSSIL